ncbi:hypothetical protein WJX79_010789 [Trebouxia sp. C0005]
MYSPTVKEEPVAQETSTVKPGPIHLSQEERQALQLSECSEDKCEQARLDFVRDTVAKGLPSPDDWRCTLHLRGSESERGKGVHNRKRAKVTTSSPHPSRLLANLKEDDLEQSLLAIPIYCGSPEHRKHGLWRPIQKTVECMDQDCRDKPAHERVMKCSGRSSFEAHCGKNPKQQHWRSNFKVDVEGFRGQSVEKFVAAHGRAVDHGRLHGRQERSVAEAQDNLETQDDLEAQHDIEAQDGLEAHDDLQEQDDLDAMAQDDASSDALKQAQVQAQNSLDAECAQQRQAPYRAVADNPATQQESKQARLKKDHKNLSSTSKSQERRARLAEGVRLRGSCLPDSWDCKVVPRPDGTRDVFYYSPEGFKFRSDLEVYRHLGLDVCVAAESRTQKRNTHTANDKLVVKRGKPESTNEPYAPADGDLKLVHNLPITDLPDHLQKVSIKCNGKHGVWHLADNLVECTDHGCTICQGKTAQSRFMKRSGPLGFSKHCGKPPEAIWRSAFKVQAAGFEGMSVEHYFKQQGYSLKGPAKRQTPDAQGPSSLMAAQQLHVKTPSSSPKNMTGQVAQATAEAPDPSNVIAQSPSTLCPPTGLQQTPSMPVESGGKAQQAAHQPDGVMQSELAALVSSMRDDNAAQLAAEKQACAAEVGALKSSAVLARQEYLQALDKIKELEAEVYDLRVGKSAV